jgi:hypothetical protein
MMPRFLMRFAAFVCGRFWIRCRRCGQYFAGFDREMRGSIYQDGKVWVTCCPPDTGLVDKYADERRRRVWN